MMTLKNSMRRQAAAAMMNANECFDEWLGDGDTAAAVDKVVAERVDKVDTAESGFGTAAVVRA
jgi:hypothetical protein